MTAKILLLIIGFGSTSDVIVPLAEQYDDAKSCAAAAIAIDFTSYTRVIAVCVDSGSGQVAYLRAKPR
jgi:hypothetical protein